MKKLMMIVSCVLLAGVTPAALLVEESWDYGIGSASSTWTGGLGFSSSAWNLDSTDSSITNGLEFGPMPVSDIAIWRVNMILPLL